MIDEGKLSQAAAKGSRAENLLRNELFNEAHAELEKQLIEAWMATPPRDTEGRERCWAAVQANRRHKGYFQSVIDNGKLAAAELKELIETAERKKRFGII